MTRIKNILALFTIATISLSCIHEIELYSTDTTPLVISGSFTTLPGEQLLRVNYQNGYNEPSDYSEVRSANVQINDLTNGSSEQLRYTDYGRFKTSDNFQLEVGHEYQLVVELSDGKRFISSIERVLPVSVITDAYYKEGPGTVDFMASIDDIHDTENYYRWRYGNTFEIFAPYANNGGQFNPRSNCYPRQYAIDQEETCWVQQTDLEYLEILTDKLFANSSIDSLLVYRQELNNKFNYGFLAEIQLQSLNKAAYDYWNQIKSQIGNKGTIFEKSNYQIKGNIQSENDDTLVLGYFTVSDVSIARVFVEQYMGTFGPPICEPNIEGCRPLKCVNCLGYGPSSSQTKPEYWPR